MNYLPVKDTIRLGKCCKYLNKLVQREDKFWASQIRRDFFVRFSPREIGTAKSTYKLLYEVYDVHTGEFCL